MRLSSIFSRIPEFAGSEFAILKGEYDRDGRLANCNRGLEELLLRGGMLDEPLIGRLFPAAYPAGEIERMFESLETENVTARTFTIGRMRTSYLCLERPLALTGRVSLIAIPFDKANVLQLLRMYSQFEGYYNSNPDIVIAVDGAWKLVDINQAGLVKLGYADKRSFLTCTREDVFVLSGNAFEYVIGEIRKGNSISEFEVILKKRTGGFITGYASVFSITSDPSDELLLYLHVKDVTLQTAALTGQIQSNVELAELNDELNRAHATMVSQEKMAALGLLAAGMAHEINNPLGFVFNNITVLMNHLRDLKAFVESVRLLYGNGDPKIAEIASLDQRIDLNYIFEDVIAIESENREGVERIRMIINSLKDFARDSTVHSKSYFDLNKAVGDTLTISRNEYKYKVEIEEEYGEVGPILCNGLEINQVLLALLMNAIESIKRQKRRDMGTIRIRTHQDERNTYFTIHDDGEGIPDSIRSRIFDPFFTTKPIGGGTGLGLAVAQDIVVNRHGGTLRLLTDTERGATFQLSLPRERSMEEA